MDNKKTKKKQKLNSKINKLNKMNKFLKINKVFTLLIILILFEIVLSSILTLAKYNNTISELCGENIQNLNQTTSLNSCSKVQNSKFSNIIIYEEKEKNKTFEIPLSLIGAIYYSILLFILMKYYNSQTKQKQIRSNKKKELENKIQKYKNIIISLSIVGVFFSFIFTLIQKYILNAYCKFCLISALNTIIIFILIIIYTIYQNKNN